MSIESFKVVGSAPHIEKNETQSRPLTNQCREYRFFTDRHQNNNAIFTTKINLIQTTTF